MQDTMVKFYAGERVRGKYFGHPFTGQVVDSRTLGAEVFVCVSVDIPFEYLDKTREYVTVGLPTDKIEGHSTIETMSE